MSRLHPRTIEALVLLPATLVLAVGIGAPTLWLLVPFVWITSQRRPYEEYGLCLGKPGSLGFHALVVTTIFGGYALLHYGFTRIAFGAHFEPTLNPNLLQLAITHIVVIGLSEEVFFRGYLQTELDKTFGKPYRLLGVQVGWGLILASLLFGLCHVITGDWGRVRVAFFGLFAGWLRARTGGVVVPALYHGFANILYDFMRRSMIIP